MGIRANLFIGCANLGSIIEKKKGRIALLSIILATIAVVLEFIGTLFLVFLVALIGGF